MFIRIGNETLKLVESKTILQQYGVVETGRIEITTYNPSMIINDHPMNLFTNRNVLFLFYPFVIEHIAKPQYRFKNFIFQVCAELKTTGRVKNLTIELTRWDGHRRTLPLVSARIVWQIHTMEEITFMEPIRDIKLVIIAQEEQLLRGILRTLDDVTARETNENETFKIDECAVCMSNPPNVLFCNCGHLCICSGCFETIRQVKTPCVVCKEENATI